MFVLGMMFGFMLGYILKGVLDEWADNDEWLDRHEETDDDR